jgi:preprotein translocase subunit SecE
VARQTRQQRRDRRRQQEDGAALERPRAREQQQARAAAPAVRPDARPRRGGARGFIAESWAELNKVEWPGREQLIQGTAVVLIACVIVGLYLWGADLVFKRLVQQVFLR